MAKFAKKYPVDNTFTTSEGPVGDYEREQSIRHIAESIKYQGLRPEGRAMLYAEAHEFLNLVESIGKMLPQADNIVWQKHGRVFSKWKILVQNWAGVLRVHMLHTQSQTTVHYKKYWVKGSWYFIELAKDMQPIKESKMTVLEFYDRLVKMTKSPFPKQVDAVAKAVTKYVYDSLSDLNKL